MVAYNEVFCHLSEIILKQLPKGGLISESFSFLSLSPKNVLNHYPQLFARTNEIANFLFKLDQKRSGQNTIEVAYLDFMTLQYLHFF